VLGDHHQAVGIRDLGNEESTVAGFWMLDVNESLWVGGVMLVQERSAEAAELFLVRRRRWPDRDHAGNIARIFGVQIIHSGGFVDH
jgi:hypothetical protein